MNRRGVALIAVLWLLVALSALIAAQLTMTRLGIRTSQNRIVLTRSVWAREACAEIVLARYQREGGVQPVDTTDLGPGTWCRATIVDPAARLNVNLASPEALLAVLRNQALVDALLDWRDTDHVARTNGAEADWYRSAGRALPRDGPLADVRELLAIRGFDSASVARVADLFTTRGDGRINPNLAPADVVLSLPGVERAALEWLPTGQGTHVLINLDEWIAGVSPSSRRGMLAEYRALSSATTFAPVEITAVVEGGVRGWPLRAVAALTLVPVANRLAVVRRETM